MDTVTNDSNLNNKLSAIDKALAAARARKAAKKPDAESTEASPKTPRGKVDPSTKAADKAAKDADRAARQEKLKAEREERRAAKEADRANGKPAHMKKIATAASKLPALNDAAQILFTDITSNLSREQVAAISLHLQHFNRVRATETALNQKLQVGQQVRILGGDPRFVGKTGTIAKAQRIRCYVDVPGARRSVYLFTSEVEIIADPVVKTGTEG